MALKKYQWRLLFKVLLQFITAFTTAYLIVNQKFVYLIIVLPVIIYQVFDLLRFHQKAHQELSQFVEGIQYRDFSRHFSVKQAPAELQELRKGFNDINSTFKIISKEKETQYVYLQKILELVDTGILSYQTLSGEISWMNESLKKMLNVPYLKTIVSLQKRNENLYKEILEIKPGERRIVIIRNASFDTKYVLSATGFQTDGENFKLIAFQNINDALEETEAKAWQKLLSVMTHEIMNSIAPISSLSATLKSRINEIALAENNKNNHFDDLKLGIDTIKRRSEGLLRFAETYRNLNKIARPNLHEAYVRDLFENIYQLMLPTLQQKNIELDIILKNPNLTTNVDLSLIEQVLINLVLNAIDAVKEQEQPQISLSAYSENNKIIIKVTDNGVGIEDAVLDQIFIPFFSSKKNGSGIGLSLCKQIMLLHKGNIQVQSILSTGTTFTLNLPG